MAKIAQTKLSPDVDKTDRVWAYKRAQEIFDALQGRIRAGKVAHMLRQEGFAWVLPREVLLWKEQWIAEHGVAPLPEGPQTDVQAVGTLANLFEELGWEKLRGNRMTSIATDLADFAGAALAHARKEIEAGKLDAGEVVRLALDAAKSSADVESRALDMDEREKRVRGIADGTIMEGEVLPPPSSNSRLANVLSALPTANPKV